MSIGGASGEKLRSLIERVERLEQEKAAITADIAAVYSEAKSQGFDTKTMREIVKLRKLDPLQREEQEALLDIYKAALGMLYDTPLGEAARRRLEKKPKRDDDGDGQYDIEDRREPEPEPEAPAPFDADADIDKAREMGDAAARAGQSVTANPFPARDPRRAAWDEAWCRAAGSDGMDLPEAWRRSKKPKKPDDEGSAE
ncbi:DUF2312 domain-containing protein [Oleispirillum naphthae]|uniref:DUF2312 domain-containing protein n=1 Tax=Oleispirillum naphthae TaxID=2838853 RepID=UPI0030825648